MRTLYLVGMAPPIEKQSELSLEERDTRPRPSGSLGHNLVPLDPRHGVFPNHVMTPLLSTLYYLRHYPEAAIFLNEQLPILLQDDSPRRFNVLMMPQGGRLTSSPACINRLNALCDASELWLVFGFWSISSIAYYLIKRHTEFAVDDVKHFSRQFLTTVLSRIENTNIAPHGIPKRIAPLPGIYFRLCTTGDTDAPEVVAALRSAIADLSPDGADAERIVRILRCLVPLPHDEAYKNKPVGKFQNCFMLCADPDRHKDCGTPPQVFWQYMGSRVKERLMMGVNPLG